MAWKKSRKGKRKGRKCLVKEIRLYKKWLCFKKKTYLCPSISYKIELQNDR